MYPTLTSLSDGAAIHTYGLLVMLAFVAGFLTSAALMRRVGIPVERGVAAFAITAVTGLTGARLLYMASTGSWDGLFASGGFAYYGGVLGGIVGLVVAARMLQLPAWKLFDTAAPGLALAYGIGRLGCFFAGCCHGAPVPHASDGVPLLPDGLLGGQILGHGHFPWVSLVFDGGVSRIQGVPLYPTQLWQSAAGFLVAGLLLAAFRHRRFDGQITALYLLTEPWTRAFVEVFRADHRGWALSWTMTDPPAWLRGMASAGAALPDGDAVVVGVTTSQGVAAGLVVAGVAIFALRWRAGVAEEPDVDAEPVDDLVGA